MKKTILFLAILMLAFQAYAQTGKYSVYGVYNDGKKNQLVWIDIRTGVATQIGTGFSSNYIESSPSMDQGNNRLIYLGQDANNNERVYTVDASTGKVIYSCDGYGDALLQYDNKVKKAYMIKEDTLYGGNFNDLYELDLKTGKKSFITITPDSVSGLDGIQPTYNNKDGQFVFFGTSAYGDNTYFLNSSTGVLGTELHMMTGGIFDDSTGNLYMLYQNNGYNFGKVDTSTGKLSKISSVNIPNGAAYSGGCYAFNPQQGWYIGISSDDSIYTIEAKTGKVLYRAPISSAVYGHDPIYLVWSPKMPNTSLNTVSGKVTQSIGASLQNSKIYLVRFNNLDTTVTVTDSTVTDTGGNYSFSTSDTSVFLYAFPDASKYSTQMPTWRDTTLAFYYAKPVSLSSGNKTINFSTLYGSNPGGPGFIGGSVTKCLMCKKAGAGQKVVGLKIILVDGKNNPVKYTYTDSKGYFSFKNIALKDYKFIVDYPGITNAAPPMLTLTSADKSKDSLNFVLYSDKMVLSVKSGIEEIALPDNSLMIYPNPASGSINVKFAFAKDEYASVGIYSLDGKLLSTLFSGNLTNGNHDLNFDISKLTFAAGVYIIKLRTNEFILNRKLLINSN